MRKGFGEVSVITYTRTRGFGVTPLRWRWRRYGADGSRESGLCARGMPTPGVGERIGNIGTTY